MTALAAIDGDDDGQTPELLRFVAGLRRLRLRREAAAAAWRSALVLAVPFVVLAWLLPALALSLLAALVAATALSAAAAAWRASRRDDAALLRDVDAQLAGLPPAELAKWSDEFTTWLEAHRRGRRTAMLGWLARDVALQLPSVGPRALRAAGRRRIGRLAWVAALLVLLLLAWLLSWLLAPQWPGLLGGAATPPPPASGDQAGGEQPGGGAITDGAPEQPTRPEGAPGSDAPVPPPPEPPESTEPPASAPPPPLLDLPSRQQFLVPEFIGDGPTRRVQMHAAEQDDAPPPPVQRGGSDRPVEAPPLPPPQREQFERAAEQALRARHVPPPEQAIVRRYFEALREAAK